MPLPTIIVVHPKERTSKCTVAPLRGQDDFVFWKFPKRGSQTLDNYVRLGIGGPLITPEDAKGGLLVLDGTWKWAAKMEQDFSDLPVRSLPQWKTAYPRTSKLYEDPDAGLATIEAIFAAYTHLGKETDGLLANYYWEKEFLELNRELIASRST